MFESDDFDQVLSQLDFPEDVCSAKKSLEESIPLLSVPVEHINKENTDSSLNFKSNIAVIDTQKALSPDDNILPGSQNKNFSLKTRNVKENFVSPKHMKRKLINSHFDQKSKRKFPGPAGLLSGTLEDDKDESICHMELLSQDLEFSQNNLRGDLFVSPIWLRLLEDVDSWQLNNIDSIKTIKQQALAGNLRKRKAQTVTAFVESIDRSATDPLIILRDSSGHIKCTLHRDAWSIFSTYIVSEYCALVLWKPTVLTTGGAFKKHYLNITLSNIYAVYSSTVATEDDKQLPDGYVVVTDEDFTVIKTEAQDLGANLGDNNSNEANNILDDLDSIFSEELF